MYASVPYKRVVTQGGTNTSKKRKTSKPWWSYKLTEMWSRLSLAEREWLRSSDRRDKINLKAKYVKLRKEFDREVQRAKRMYWFSLQPELLNECNIDQTRFWKSIGKVGASSRSKSFIPFEVVNVDGSTTTSTVDVLGKWKSEFSNLFNSYQCENDDDNSSHNQVSDLNSSCPLFEDNISILEVKKSR